VSSSRPEPESRASSWSEGARSSAAKAPGNPLPIHDAVDLLGGGNLAMIVLDGQTYHLRRTRSGKLILNK